MKKHIYFSVRNPWPALCALLLTTTLRHAGALDFAVPGPPSAKPPSNVVLNPSPPATMNTGGSVLGYYMFSAYDYAPPGQVVFKYPPTITKPRQPVLGFTALFDIIQDVRPGTDGNEDDGMDASFWFAPQGFDPDGGAVGLRVRYRIDIQSLKAVFVVYWNGLGIGNLEDTVSLSSQGPGIDPVTRVRVEVDPNASVGVWVIKASGEQLSVASTSLPGWNPDGDWIFAFTGAPVVINNTPAGAFFQIGVQNVDISAQTAPFFKTALSNRQSYQDFTNSYDFLFDTWENHPENVQVKIQSSNPAVFGPENFTITAPTPTNRHVLLNPKRGANGTTTVTVTLDPGNGGTGPSQTYVHDVVSNVPPSITALGNVTVPQNTTRIIPFSIGSAHWPLSQVNVEIAQSASNVVNPYDVFVRTFDPDRKNWELVLTPGLAQPGTGNVVVRVTDGSGDHADSSLSLTTVPANDPPTVLGSGSALSLNTGDDLHVQYAFETNVSDLALGTNATVEAWVRPVGFTDPNLNFVAFVGARLSAQCFILALQSDGSPSFASINNDYYSTNALYKIPTNEWHHLAAVVSGQTVNFYVDGQFSSSGPLKAALNITSDQLMIGNEPSLGGNASGAPRKFIGDIDEVRVWNVPRTASDIASNMRRRVPSNTTGLVRYYRFDEGFLHFDGANPALPTTGNPLGGTIVDSSAGAARAILAEFPHFVPGVPIETTIDVEQDITNTIGLAMSIDGMNAWGAAGVEREIYFGPNSPALSTGLGSSPGWPSQPDAVFGNGVGLEIPQGGPLIYGERIRGYLLPPETGTYTLSIASANEGQLWLSPSEDSTNISIVASSPATGVSFRHFNLNASQSTNVQFTAGKRYYFEVRHQVGDGSAGNPHLSVQWTLPQGAVETPIPAHRIQPIGPAPSGQSLSVTLVENPESGVASPNGASLQYGPFQNFYGSDDLSFRVSNGSLQSIPSHLILNVLNDMPSPVAGAGNALNLDGVSGALASGSTFSLGNDSFTVELWAKRSSSTLSGDQVLWSHGTTAAGFVSFGWFANSNTNMLGFRAQAAIGSPQDFLTLPYSDTDWHHYAVVFTATNRLVELFRDGNSLGTNTVSPNFSADSAFYLGSFLGNSAYFPGTIDEVRVWQRARTQLDLQASMTTPLFGNEDRLILYYRLDEGNGLTAYDSSSPKAGGVHYDGVLTNLITWVSSVTNLSTLVVPRNSPGQQFFLPGFAPGNVLVTYSITQAPVHGELTADPVHPGVFTFVPKTNYFGADSFLYTVSNGNLTSSQTVVNVNVKFLPIPPQISTIRDQAFEEEDPALTIPFTLADVDNPSGNLLHLSATSSNPTLLPVANIQFGGSGNSRTVTLDPVNGEIGSSTVTITVKNANNLTASISFLVRVNSRLAYEVIPVGEAVGQTFSVATAVNASGQVSGYAASDASVTNGRPFRYNGFGSATPVVSTETLGGGSASALGLNAAGLLVGVSDNPQGQPNAFQVDPVLSSMPTSLGTLPGGTLSVATAANDSGLVVGYAQAGDGSFHAITAGSTALTALPFPNSFAGMWALAVNNAGLIAGYGVDSSGATNGFITALGQTRNLGRPAGATHAIITSINADGIMAGHAIFPSAPVLRPVINDGNQWTVLDDPLGGGSAEVWGINRFRQVVGRALTTNGVWHGYLFSDGRFRDLNSLRASDSDYLITDARGLNNQGQIAASGQRDVGLTQALLLFPASEIGRRVFRPTGTLPALPQITIIDGGGNDQSGNSFFWSATERKLYAIRPVVASLGWHTGTYVVTTNLTEFGDNVIRQTVTNEVLVQTLSFNVWPADPEIHVVGTPVQSQPDQSSFQYHFMQLIYTTSGGAAVDNNTRVFTTPSTGYSVLQYLLNNGLAPDPQTQPNHFTVVRSVLWNDPNYVVTNVAWTVGQAITNSQHQDYPGLNGYVLSTNAYFDGVGSNAAYTRTNRTGPILPVNANDRGEEFVVVWYSPDRIGTSWSRYPVSYAVSWPTNPDTIVIASQLGSGTLSGDKYLNPMVYEQSDSTLPGFNPNEEHALLAPGPDGTVLYALRDDLNDKVDPKASDPYVLLKFQDPTTQVWRMQVFNVVEEQFPYTFNYSAVAGEEIAPPLPLSLLPLATKSNKLVSGPGWQDYNGKFYARAAGADGGGAEVIIEFYYPLQPGFFYDLNRDGKPEFSVGDAVPWLGRRTNAPLHQPVDIHYGVTWPTDVPILDAGQTLTTATGGLPDIADMASAQVVFDSLDPYGTNASQAAARLFDPLTPRFVDLGTKFQFPTDVQRSVDPASGNETFPDLPYYLRVRLFHDPRNHRLGFRGFNYVPPDGGATLLLVNVMTIRERGVIEALDASGDAAFKKAVDSLCIVTRNPNLLDLTTPGQPDDALLVGLTQQIVTNGTSSTTNVVRETFGGSPKALTTGQPLPAWDDPRPYAIRFDGTSGTRMAVGTNYASITNNFTVEFWVKPEQSEPETPEEATGIVGQKDGTQYVLYPTHGQVAYGSGHAGAGVAVGTDRIAVFEHTDNLLCTLLVYPVTLNGWHHVAVVYQENTPTLYLDGVKVRTGLSSPRIVHPSADIASVDASWGGYGSFVGTVTDVRVWNVARSPDDIVLNFARTLSGTETNLAGLWLCQEGNGALVHDLSAAGHNGSLAGGYTWAQGTGLAGRYVVIAENNDPTLPGLPVGLHVIQLGNPLTRGSLAIIQPDNVLDERVTIRHSEDFAGQPSSYYFQWFYQFDSTNFDASLMPVTTNGVITNPGNWLSYPMDPADGTGVNDITLGSGQLSGLVTLSDTWFIMRYGYVSGGQTNWSDWAGDPAAGVAPRAMFVPGWVKRVLKGINLFAQRSSDFQDNTVNTLASALSQAGPRYEGDVALNPSQLDQFGLIEIYSTILNRARNLSINGSPPVDFAPANSALLLAAGNIADLYLLHANEAFAEAEDPTIGLTTDSPELGSLASSVFAFQNQVDSLLEEELVLLRGRDDTSEGVGAAPVYNRFYWNFTGGDGELAYVSKFGIPDENNDGFINALDAQVLYPQGHGDAWGHYLTAQTTYYDLLRNANYTWIPRTQDTLVAGVPVQVNYDDERRFARSAAAKARTGAEIVSRTFKLNYTDDVAARIQNQQDANPQRAWGISDWGRRGAMGAYFDWITGNAILPPVDPDPTHTGIQKIDRTTVPELSQIVTESDAILNSIAQYDGGLNPLGFATGVVPFDIDPDLLETGFSRETHFEQIYDRALTALQNAEVTFNRATALSSELVQQQNSASDFSTAVFNQELSYRNQLIAIFGYPYAGDMGPGGAFPSEYQGPDLTHYMYVDTLDVTPENNPRGTGFTNLSGIFNTLKALAPNWGSVFSSDTLNAVSPTTNRFIEVDYPISTASYAFQAPSVWGNRRAEGSLQTSIRQLVLAQVQLQQAVTSYDNLIKDLEQAADLLTARYNLKQAQIQLLTTKEGVIITFDTLIGIAKTAKIAADAVSMDFNEAGEALLKAIPGVEGLAFDAFAPIAASVFIATSFTKAIPHAVSEGAEIAETALDFSKEVTEIDIDRQIEVNEQNFELTERLKELEGLVRQEASLRLGIFNAEQGIIQAARNVESTLASGQQILEQRTVFRRQSAGTISADRYADLGLRTFRNDALQKYDTQFELTARYVLLAASAYNYEVNGADGGNASSYIANIVKERNLGELNDGEPVVGRVGLATILGRLKQNFDVLKGQLGLNNTRNEQSRFSLRTEALRILPSLTNSTAVWRSVLQKARVADLWTVPEFRRYCRPFAPEGSGPQPGLVLRFSTTITAGQNFFGRTLGPLDSSYDSSEYSTRIRSVGVWFTDYDANNLAAKPRVYLVPTGADLLRSPNDNFLAFRTWQVVDQRIPVPFPVTSGDLDDPSWIPGLDNQDGSSFDIRRHSAFRAYQDSTFDSQQFTDSSRLVGRSVANTQWVLIIPGAYLLGDASGGLDKFVASVSDIKLYFQSYSTSGN